MFNTPGLFSFSKFTKVLISSIESSAYALLSMIEKIYKLRIRNLGIRNLGILGIEEFNIPGIG